MLKLLLLRARLWQAKIHASRIGWRLQQAEYPPAGAAQPGDKGDRAMVSRQLRRELERADEVIFEREQQLRRAQRAEGA